MYHCRPQAEYRARSESVLPAPRVRFGMAFRQLLLHRRRGAPARSRRGEDASRRPCAVPSRPPRASVHPSANFRSVHESGTRHRVAECFGVFITSYVLHLNSAPSTRLTQQHNIFYLIVLKYICIYICVCTHCICYEQSVQLGHSSQCQCPVIFRF